jgi:hypothetical protein
MTEDQVNPVDEEGDASRSRHRRRRSAPSGLTPSMSQRPQRPVPRPAPTVRTLTLRNRSATLIQVPVLNDDGSKRNIRLGKGQTAQVLEDRLTDHAMRLVSLGRISIRPIR